MPWIFGQTPRQTCPCTGMSVSDMSLNAGHGHVSISNVSNCNYKWHMSLDSFFASAHGHDFEASSVFRYVPKRKYVVGGTGGDGVGGKEAQGANEAEEAGSQKFSPGAWLRKRQVQQAHTTRTHLQHSHTSRTTSTRKRENEERTWNTRFEQLKIFMEQHQHDHVSRASATGLTGRCDKLLPLWIWVGKQRNANALGNFLSRSPMRSVIFSLALSLFPPRTPSRVHTHLYVSIQMDERGIMIHYIF